MDKTIYIAGEGWGNESAYAGLCKQFSDVRRITETDLPKLIGATIVFAGYKPIVPHDVLINNDCINIHYSLLPKYRGLHATAWNILNDDDYLGLTVHIMNDFIDDGPIIHQYKVKNDRIKTCIEYMELLNAYIVDSFGHILNEYLEGNIELTINDKSKATWVGMRNHQDCRIDFNRDLNYLHCFFRTLVAPYPLPFVEYKGEEFIVTKVDYHPQNVETHIGRILNIDEDGLWVKAKDGYLIIKELRDSTNAIADYNRFRIGQFFNR